MTIFEPAESFKTMNRADPARPDLDALWRLTSQKVFQIGISLQKCGETETENSLLLNPLFLATTFHDFLNSELSSQWTFWILFTAKVPNS